MTHNEMTSGARWKLQVRFMWAVLFVLLRIAAKIGAVPSFQVEDVELELRRMKELR